MVFNTTFNNISAISWQSVLLVEETGIPGENHRPYDTVFFKCGKCLKSKSGLRRHRLRQHLKQEIKFKCTTDSCTAAFCEKGELLAHQPW